ncbi:lysozyme inhibitor LprI family protein [Acinetobacter chinensis]|uniref:Lysozyme inhibitor LprI family protein n=1 Tax=Acinetobacter chinensis TaxID=2004650 RepID=A0ABU3WCV3_9GAMM|nr:lysozyme inhibitor LprI family protein [Acinetobacter chinensis]MDV2468240.1 lysozyme inhibitor LprI family protein [Acinetobacter chinensis]
MKILMPVIVVCCVFGAGSASAKGFSKEYTRCLNTSYGNNATVKKCAEKEYKEQEKRLKETFKNYLGNSGSNQQNIMVQHKLWENRVQQQCYFKSSYEFAEVQKLKCILAMTVNQADYYQTKFITAK